MPLEPDRTTPTTPQTAPAPTPDTAPAPDPRPDYAVQKRRARGTRRFYLLAFLIYLPVLYSLAVIQARWYGWLGVGLSALVLIGMRRTRAWKGLRIPLSMAAALVVALLSLLSAQPTRDVSLGGQIIRGTVRTFSNNKVVAKVFSSEVDLGITWEPPEGYTLTGIQLSTCRLEYLRVNAGAKGRLILQFHGGGYVAGLNDMYRRMALEYSQAANADVISLDYRLAPEYPYPAQQEDALATWHFVVGALGYKPENITIAGDSAGGNLTLGLCLRLRDQGLKLPRSLVCLSAWGDLSGSGPSHVDNARVDVMFGVGDDPTYDGSPVLVQSTYADGLNAKDPYLSPSFGDYTGFPPMLLQVGGDELLLSDTEMVKAACDAAGVDCTLQVFPGMFHVFQASPFATPERTDAWQKITEFLQR